MNWTYEFIKELSLKLNPLEINYLFYRFNLEANLKEICF